MPTSHVPSSRIPLLVALLLAAGLAGCISPIEPESGSASGLSEVLQGDASDTGGREGVFYPLHPGNSWHYQKSFTMQVFPDGEPPLDPVVTNSTVERRQLCWDAIGARRYLAEEATETGEGGTFTTWIYLRDDKSGLFEADVDIGTQPTCDDEAVTAMASRSPVQPMPAMTTDPEVSRQLAGLPAAYRVAVASLERKRAVLADILRQRGGERVQAEGELTRLSYPLQAGATWSIREDPLFEARAEGVDAFPIQSGRVRAWRIRYTSELFGPNDVVKVWYSRWGYLGLEAHLEGDAVDENGNVIGRVQDEIVERVDEIHLVKGRFGPH